MEQQYNTKTSPGVLGPIVIGGIGGSGTRIVAQIVQKLGIDIGFDLNESMDNLTFTLLFKQKKWLYHNLDSNNRIHKRIKVLEKALSKKNPLKISDFVVLFSSAFSMAVHGHNHLGSGRGLWPFVRILNVVKSRRDQAPDLGWGWKEPNSHVILRSLYDFFPDIKYIHCVRHGLDMAFSENQQQLKIWGPLYGIDLLTHSGNLAKASFRFWCEANRQALKTGQEMGPDRFLLLNYDNLCKNPESGLNRIFNFLSCDPSPELKRSLKTLPRIPDSVGRYRHFDHSWLKSSDKNFLEELEFTTGS